MRKYLSHPIISSSIITVGFAGVVHLLNYIYVLVCVRLLTPVEYSDLALIISFYSIMGVFSATLTSVSLALLSRKNRQAEYTELKQQILHFSTLFIYVTFVISITTFTPIIHFFFKVDSITEIIIILTAGLLSIGTGLLSVHFQLKKEFLRNSLFGLTAAVFKLMFSVFLLYLGYKIFGVAIALFLSSLLAFVFFYQQTEIATYKYIFIPRRQYLQPALFFLKRHKQFFFKSLISSLAVTMCLVLDTILAKKLLSTELAAQYIGMSTLAKIFFYTIGAICGVMFPYLLNEETLRRKELFTLFSIFIVGSGVIAAIILDAIAIPIIRLILSSAYINQASNFIYVFLNVVAATFAYFTISISSMLDAPHFSKVIGIATGLGFVIFFTFRPTTIPTLSLFLILIFATSSLVLYNIVKDKLL